MHWIKDPLVALVRRFGKPSSLARAIGVLLGLTSITAASLIGVGYYSYVQKDPRFCRSCHTMENAWDRWDESSHRSVACSSCHGEGLAASAEMVVKYAIQRPQSVSKHASVPDENCSKCHESNDPRWIQVAATAGHLNHAADKGIVCTNCHSATLHRFEPPRHVCGVCHSERQIRVPEMADFHCMSCHDFLAMQSDLLPGRERCLACHGSMPQVEVTWPPDSPMKWKCGACHKPHEQAKSRVDCESCHQGTGLTGLHRQADHSSSPCESCHRPHEWRIAGQDACLACHHENP